MRIETIRMNSKGEEIPIIAKVFPYEIKPGVLSIAALIERR